MSQPSFQPTFYGFVESTYDAIIICEAALSDYMPMLHKRPTQDECKSIKSGDIFVYLEESAAGNRFTDYKIWSSSRIVQNFVVYKELSEPIGKRKQRKKNKKGSDKATEADSDAEVEIFKEGGLCKRAISIGTLKLLAYYALEDVREFRLRRPSDSSILRALPIRDDLLKQKYRFCPFTECEDLRWQAPADWNIKDASREPGSPLVDDVTPSDQGLLLESIPALTLSREPELNYNGADFHVEMPPPPPRRSSIAHLPGY